MTDESDRLRQAREMAGLGSAADAARRLGMDYPTYAAHENGTRGFNKDQAAKYARAFRINILWLLYGLGTPGGVGLEQQVLELPPEKRKQFYDFLKWLRESKAAS